MIDKELYNYIFSNNTFDLKSLEEALNEIKHNSFKFLYNVQLSLTGYKRFDLKMKDLSLMNLINNSLSYYPRKYVGFISENFINESNRLSFKKSRFYNKEISIFDVANNSDLFSYAYMVFVDGKFFDTINVLCKEDVTYFIFDIKEVNNTTGIPKAYFEELMEKNADITIFYIPNCSFGVYNTNVNVLQKYKDALALKRFNISNNIDTPEKYITFINTNDLLFSSVITDTENSAEFLKFSDNSINNFDNKLVHLNIFGFRHLLDQIDLTGGTRYFQLPIQDMPIPVESFMIFRCKEGRKYFAHDLKIRMYYPNIYEVIGNTTSDDLTIYAFYSDDTITTTLKYKNELALYHKFIGVTLEKYANYTIPDIIRSYQPLEYQYDIKHYEQSIMFPDHLKYKIELLREWIRQNNDLLKTYLYKQMRKTFKGYYVDVSKINLQSKYRENNFNEIKDGTLHQTFDEPRYVFILRNEYKDEFYRLRFFIDGRMYVPDKAFKDKTFEYYYIPTSIVKADSIIEIERFDELAFSVDISFTSISEEKYIKLPQNDFDVNANDIFLVKKSDMTYLYREDFTMSAILPDRERIDLGPDSFKEVKDFFIRLNNPEYLNTPLKLYIRKNSFYQEWTITNDLEADTGILVLNLQSIPDSRHYRIFRNGYLLPQHLYNIDFGVKMSDVWTVALDMRKRVGDRYVIDCTPYKYKQVYYEKLISPKGFIDLSGKIDKPFDLKYFDVYLNGIRMTKKNIEVITPTKIVIKNVSTRKNLSIVQKDRDPEVFSIGEWDALSPDDYLWDNMVELRSAIMSSFDNINDSMEDIITELIETIGADFIKFYEFYMKYRFINPDQSQIPNSQVRLYPSLFNSNKVVMLNPDMAEGQAVTIHKIIPEIPS